MLSKIARVMGWVWNNLSGIVGGCLLGGGVSFALGLLLTLILTHPQNGRSSGPPPLGGFFLSLGVVLGVFAAGLFGILLWIRGLIRGESSTYSEPSSQPTRQDPQIASALRSGNMVVVRGTSGAVLWSRQLTGGEDVVQCGGGVVTIGRTPSRTSAGYVATYNARGVELTRSTMYPGG